MPIQLFNRSANKRIGAATVWVERYGSLLLSPEDSDSHQPPQMPFPQRGILLQSIFGGGMGVAELIARIPDIYAFRVDIVGQNPTEQSAFKLLVSGTDSLGASTELFETAPIPSVSTADEIRTILLTAALGMSLPIKRTDIEVRLGNPVSVINPVLLTPASLQPELDVSDPDNIESYVGSWYIRFTGALTTNYSSITAEVVQDTSAFMRGVSAVVTQPTTDMPSGETTIFHDVINRPYNFPWRIGTTCIATYFIGIGMGIIGSDFRNLESVVLSAPDEGGEEE